MPTLINKEKRTNRTCIVFLTFLLLFSLLAACTPEPVAPAIDQGEDVKTDIEPEPDSSEPMLSLKEIADRISEDVGKVVFVWEGDSEGAVFVFEEQHNSILGQVEIAVMFNRLYEDHGVRHIGLEGLAAEDGILDLSWAHYGENYNPSEPISVREDVLSYMAFDGILNSAELIGLIYFDIHVHGIDDALLYAIPKTGVDFNSPLYYLYGISLQSMSDADYTAWEALYSQGMEIEAFEFAMSTDEYTSQTYERLLSSANALSAEESYSLMEEIQIKVSEANANLSDEQTANMENFKEYLLVVSQRSTKMAENALFVLESNPEALIPISVGFMHTDRIAEMLEEAEVSYVIIQAKSLAEENNEGFFTEESYIRLEQGLSPSPDGSLGALLEGRRKAPCQSQKSETKLEFYMRIALKTGMKKLYEEGLEEYSCQEEGKPKCSVKFGKWVPSNIKSPNVQYHSFSMDITIDQENGTPINKKVAGFLSYNPEIDNSLVALYKTIDEQETEPVPTQKPDDSSPPDGVKFETHMLDYLGAYILLRVSVDEYFNQVISSGFSLNNVTFVAGD